jgi:hypothetical protein
MLLVTCETRPAGAHQSILYFDLAFGSNTEAHRGEYQFGDEFFLRSCWIVKSGDLMVDLTIYHEHFAPNLKSTQRTGVHISLGVSFRATQIIIGFSDRHLLLHQPLHAHLANG